MSHRAVIFSFLTLALGMVSCGHAITELGDVAGCHMAGNGCDSVNMDDPNLQGPIGATGPQGPSGVPGRDGVDAEPVRFVQLCPGTPAYPSVFPEQAICSGGKLYAVYSVPGAFLTYIPDGRYSSNAIGSRCSFTVHGCEISY